LSAVASARPRLTATSNAELVAPAAASGAAPGDLFTESALSVPGHERRPAGSATPRGSPAPPIYTPMPAYPRLPWSARRCRVAQLIRRQVVVSASIIVVERAQCGLCVRTDPDPRARPLRDRRRGRRHPHSDDPCIIDVLAAGLRRRRERGRDGWDRCGGRWNFVRHLDRDIDLAGYVIAIDDAAIRQLRPACNSFCRRAAARACWWRVMIFTSRAGPHVPAGPEA
jgi:hypothetical protein